MEKINEEILKSAQYRKGLSIAFFNATNAAISLVSDSKITDQKLLLDTVKFYRDFFLEEHKNYYATVIANVGVNYRAEDTIVQLNEAKNMDELKSKWLSISEDERRDGLIIKVKETLKKKYEKAQ